MKPYKIKTKFIEATRITEEDFNDPHPNHIPGVVYDSKTRSVIIKEDVGKVGSWIIRNPNGRLSICKNDLFEETYEPIKESSHHGKTCHKVRHEDGVLFTHGPEDDGLYIIHGLTFCGRCHNHIQPGLEIDYEYLKGQWQIREDTTENMKGGFSG